MSLFRARCAFLSICAVISLAYGQSVLTDQCNTYLRPTQCGVVNDTRIQNAAECPLLNETATGSAIPFNAYWLDYRGPLTHCQLDGNTRVYAIPSWLQKSLTGLATLASFTNGADYRAEAFITAVTSSGVEHRLGSLVPGVNALVGAARSLEGRESMGYPFNGHVLCGGAVSSQSWPIPSSLADLGVAYIRIYDPRSSLKTYALTVENCTGIAPAIPVASVSLNSTNAVDTRAGFVSNTRAGSWPMCAQIASGSGAEAFLFSPGAGTCTVLNTTRLLVRGEASAPPLASGLITSTAHVYSSPRGMSGRVTTAMDAWSMLRSDLYGDLTPRLFLLLNAPGQRTIPRITLWGSGVSRYAVGASQMVRRPTQAFLTISADGHVFTCGNVTGPQNELLSPFYPINGNNNTHCDTFSHCMPREQQLFTGPLSVDLSTWPNRTQCGSQAASLLVYADGTVGGSSYSYVVFTASQYGSFAQAAAALAARHERPSVGRYETFSTSQGFAHFYNLGSPNRQTSSPEWKMTDSEGRTVNTTLWCDAYDMPHYEASYRSAPSASGTDCGRFATLEEITLACNSDVSCAGFTMSQNTSGFEVPGCLYSDVSLTAPSDSESLFRKKMARPSCSFPALGGLRLTVRVTNSVAASTSYDVLADGVVVGSCINLPISDVSDASCYNTFPCFSGDIPEGTIEVSVRASMPMNAERRCGRSVMGVAVSFDAEYTYYSPPSACLSPLSIIDGCVGTPSAVADPCLGGASTRAGITLAQTACEIDSPIGLFSEASIPNNTVGILAVIDVASMTALASAAGLIQVLMETADGSVVPLGHVVVNPSGALQHFGADQTPVDSYGICTGSIPSTVSGANAHYFAVPIGIRAKGMQRVVVRGVGARVTGLHTASAGCEAPNPKKATDIMFSAMSPYLVPSAPEVATQLSVPTVVDCALACYGTANCFVYSFSDGSCSFYNAFGVAAQLSLQSSRVTGSRTLPGAGQILYSAAIPPSSAVSSAIDALAPFGTAYAFVAEISRPMRLVVEGGRQLRALLSHASFAGEGGVVLSTPGAGAAAACGGQFLPWEGMNGVSTQCDVLASCPPLNTRTAVTGTFQLSFEGVTTQCDQGNTVWGLIAATGTIRGGAHYTALKKALGTAVPPITGPVTAVATETIAATIDGVAHTFTAIEQYAAQSARVIYGNTPVMCRIGQKVLFKVRRGASPLNVSSCPSAPMSLDSAMALCSKDASCAGLSLDSTSGAFLCFASTLATNTTASEHFLEKVEETSCSFDLTVPGVLKVSISQLNLYYGAGNDVKVYINNRLLGRCGQTEPFVGGYDQSGGSNCSSYLTCADMLVPETGTLRIVLPPAAASCNAHYGSAIVQLEAAAAESRNLHRGAATLPYRRIIRTRSPTSYGFMVSDTSQAAVLVRQDRYRCGFDCVIPSQLNLTVGGANQRLCGGLSQFAEGPGLSNECATFYYCGTSSGGNPVSFTPITTEMTFSLGDDFRSTPNCGSIFHSVAFSNGLMLAADATHYATRTVFAKRYNGTTTATTVAATTADLRSYAVAAHSAMAIDSFSSTRYFDRAFPIFNNLLSVSSSGYVLYDFADANEADKSVGEGTYACIGDKISEDGRQVVCQMRFTTNYISVSVAQTKYDTIADTITVVTNSTTKICGGDRTFFGYRGTLDACDRFYTCYEGYIEPGELVTITYSKSVIQNSRCRPSALALVTGSSRPPVPDLVCNDPLLPFKCYPSRQCFSMAKICDRFVDCADQSDEADCTTWQYVASEVSPTCPPLAHVASATTVDACRSYAVADPQRPNVFTVNKSGCFTYTCVVFESPNLQSLAPSVGTQLHALVINPSDFGFCSDSLHCSGHGAVQSISAPCVCVCDANYVGADCGTVTTPNVARQLAVIFSPNSTLTSNVLRQVETAVLSQLPSLYTVVVSGIEYRTEFSGVFLTIRNSVNGLITSDQVLGLLTNSTQTRALRSIAYAGAMYFTAGQAATPRTEYICRRDASSDPLTCSGPLRTSINSTRSLTITVFGIAITNASQWVDVQLTPKAGAPQTYRCTAANGVISTDFSQTDSACQRDTVCMFSVADGLLRDTYKIDVTMSPDLNPTEARCRNTISRVSAVVDGRIAFVDDPLTSYAPEDSNSHNNSYLYAFFALLAVGLICLVVAVAWLRLRKRYPRATIVGPISGGLTLFLITFSIVLLLYYFDSETNSYTHSFVIEDYRDPRCGASVYAPVPIRAGIIPANGKCAEVRFVGRPEESVFIGARLSQERTFPIEVRHGTSFTSCSSAPWVPYFPRACMPENSFLTDKPEIDQQWFSVRGMEKSIANERLHAVKALNPTEAPTISVPVAILPPEFRYVQAGGTKIVFLHNGISYAMERPHRDALTLMASAVGDPYLSNNVMPLEEVRFTQTIWTRKSFVDSGGMRVVDDVPYGTYKAFANMGTLFDTRLVRSRSRSFLPSATSAQGGSSPDAFIFSGIAGGPFDLSGRTSDFTLSMWVRCPQTVRGLPVVMMDGWVDADSTSPLADRLVSVIENGDLGPDWFEGWTVGAAVYLNGGNGRIALASASPSAGVKKMEWDAYALGVERLFDGTWHYLSFSVVVAKSGQMTVRLFVDGSHETSKNGWTACEEDFFKPLRAMTTGQLVPVTTQRAVVTPDGVMAVGYFGGGIFAVTVDDYAMTQQEVFQTGSQHMHYYSDVLVDESFALGICTAVITAVIVLYSIYVAFRNEFGVNEDEFEEEAQYDERGHRIRQNTEIRESKGSIFTTSVSFVNFSLPVIIMFQIITMFLQSFDWPKEYHDFFSPLAIFSLDLDAFNIDAPIILWPIVQFALAMVLFFTMMVLARVDKGRFITVAEVYREKVRIRLLEARSRQRRVDDAIEMIDIPKPNYQWVVHLDGGARILTTDQKETLTRSLAEILQSRARRETNMRVFTRNLVNMGDLGTGIILYERIQGNVFISLRTSENTLEHDQQADVIAMRQTYFEQICNNVECPEHKVRLLPDDLHASNCVHTANPYYRSKECPRKCIMYKCPDQQCEYAVCEFCYSAGGSAVSGAVSDALKRLKAVREAGIVQTLGTIIALLWGVVYIPAVKSALMIIGCHKRFRCEFDNCWQNPSVYYMVMVLVSVLILTCVAVGYVFIEALILKDRRDKILRLLPQQTRKPKNRFYDFVMPKRTIFRGDYNDFLDEDKSILRSFYTAYEFDYFYASPAFILYRLALIIVVACPPEDSLTQIGLATAVSLLFALVLVMLSVHKNVWIEGLARLGAVHILVQLALMALHRVDLRDNVFSTGYDEQMVAVTFLYVGIVGLLLVITVVVPFIREQWESRERRKKQMLNANEQIYDIGFWGEIRHTSEK